MIDGSKVISKFYNKRAKEYDDPLKVMDWSSKYAQNVRFKILTEIGNLYGKSILDVGCGFADLFVFFQKRGINVNYTGIDVSDEIINKAKEKRPDLNLICADILKDYTIPKADFVISSGIHSVKTFNNTGRVKKVIKRMYELCNMAMGTNMFSTYYPKETFAHYAVRYDPEKIFSFAKTLSDYVVLRHDYLPNDFTVYIYKNKFEFCIEESSPEYLM